MIASFGLSRKNLVLTAMILAGSGAAFVGGVAYGQRGPGQTDQAAVPGFSKLPDGRLVRPLSGSIEGQLKAVIAGAPRLDPRTASRTELLAGVQACEAKCEAFADHPPVPYEKCDPNPLKNLPNNPECKSVTTINIGGSMLVDLCKQACREKYKF